MQKQSYHIAELISQYLAETITPEELEELNNWRKASPEHEALLQTICDRKHIEQYVSLHSQFNNNEGWEKTNNKIRKAKKREIISKLSQCAALIAIPLAIGLFIAHWNYQPEYQDSVATISDRGCYILPGEKKAILTLDNGKVVDLKAAKDTQLKEEDGTAIQINSSALNYKTSDQGAEVEKKVYNKVEIPRGGEYSLTLSDGTKVYLNSMSSLRFPVQFAGSKRVVELQGEGYFEVSKNGKPFIVKTQGTAVEVLGTTFNISAYEGESYQATLVTGSVKIHTQGNSYLLTPSEQACIAPETNKVTIQKVDTQLYTSWIQGKIYFKDQRLEDIMNTLGRWYDISVTYQNAGTKNLRFGCNVDRCKEITPFLDLLERTGKVSIITNGKNINIK